MMYLGGFTGICLSLLIIWLVVECELGDKTFKIVSFICGLLTVACIKIGKQIDINDYNKKNENWKNTKQTIELALNDDKISDLEKIELVNKVVEYNKQLIELKEDVKQWWYFYLDDKKVEKLDIIRINQER